MIRRAMHLLHRYRYRNIAVADQALVSGGNFLFGILIARALGLDEFGRFTLLWMVVQFGTALQQGAILRPMSSIGPKQSRGEAPAYYGAVVLQQSAFCIVVAAMVFAGALACDVFIPEWRVGEYGVPLAASLLTSQSQEFFRRYFFVCGRPLAALGNDALRYVGQFVILVWLMSRAPHGVDSSGALWITAAAGAAATVQGIMLFEKIAWDAEIQRAIARRHWRFCKWLLPSELMHWTTTEALTTTAGAVLGVAAVGALRAAQNAIGLAHVVFKAIENFAPIEASRIFHEGGPLALHRYIIRLASIAGPALLGFLLLLNLDPSFTLRLIYGGGYEGSGYILRWYSAVYFLFLGNQMLGIWATSVESTEVIFYSFAGATAFTVLSAYPLTAFGGIIGVLCGRLFIEVLRATILFSCLWRRRMACEA